MHNAEIAWSFSELADMMELKGADYFKIRAYRHAARIFLSLEEPIEIMYKQKTLAAVPGIGSKILAKVGELLEKGKMEKLERLRAEIPGGLLEIMTLPGIGPKRAAFLYKSLGLQSIEQLEKAARNKKIRNLKGMGVKTEFEIIRNIETLRGNAGKFQLSLARELAKELLEYLEGLPGVDKVSVVGSVRRWKETVTDLDLLVSSFEPEKVLSNFTYHPYFTKILERDINFIGCLTRWGIKVELAVVSPDEYAYALFYKTGSKHHLKELSKYSGEWKPTFNGFKNQEGNSIRKNFGSEEDIYSFLKLQYIPPELREGRGEVKAARAGNIPTAVTIKSIRGDLHMHSNWSDGTASIEEIADRAREKGYEYIAITDHSQSLKIAGGLDLKRLNEQYDYIDKLNKKFEDFKVLKGIEVDILAKGGLDFDDEVLEQADVVVASVHSGFKQDRETITSRVIQAVENKHVDIIGHLTGRLLGSREAYELDIERVLEAAGRYGKVMEINSSPDRLDLNETNARMAVDFGAKIAINTDSHSLKHLDEMEYGVAIARRAGLESEDIVNTMELEHLLKVLDE